MTTTTMETRNRMQKIDDDSKYYTRIHLFNGKKSIIFRYVIYSVYTIIYFMLSNVMQENYISIVMKKEKRIHRTKD